MGTVENRQKGSKIPKIDILLLFYRILVRQTAIVAQITSIFWVFVKPKPGKSKNKSPENFTEFKNCGEISKINFRVISIQKSVWKLPKTSVFTLFEIFGFGGADAIVKTLRYKLIEMYTVYDQKNAANDVLWNIFVEWTSVENSI